MDVRKISQSQVYDSGSSTGKSPAKESKDKKLDIGFSEKAASSKEDAKALAGRAEKAPESFGCSNSCGCAGGIAKEPASAFCSNSCGCT